MSLVEAITNVIVGYGIAVATQLVVFPWFGLPARLSDAVASGGIFTIVSIARSFALRRVFEAIPSRERIPAVTDDQCRADGPTVSSLSCHQGSGASPQPIRRQRSGV